MHYRGSLISGTDFDSSYSRGEPVSFPLNGVIPGWTEGLQLMKPGGKARLVLPADLAYGPVVWAKQSALMKRWCLKLNCWK